jgi:hypothetical protein
MSRTLRRPDPEFQPRHHPDTFLLYLRRSHAITPSQNMKTRFDIDSIDQALCDFQAHFTEINDRLSLHREDLTRDMIDKILQAYLFLNHLLDQEIDIFSLAGLHALLELNHIVLCGTDRRTRLEYHSHILETRKSFHKGIHHVQKWVKEHSDDGKPYTCAAGFYALALSQPQLFIEGNHRTENVVLNYLLISAGEPPFVITAANAFDYLELSGKIKFSDKKKITRGKWAIPGLRKAFIHFLKKEADPCYLQGTK